MVSVKGTTENPKEIQQRAFRLTMDELLTLFPVARQRTMGGAPRALLQFTVVVSPLYFIPLYGGMVLYCTILPNTPSLMQYFPKTIETFVVSLYDICIGRKRSQYAGYINGNI